MTHETSVTSYRTVEVDGLNVFYREAGPREAPTLLMLHGFPSSSRMYEPLFRQLGQEFHLVAPDYPGFGHSDAPAAAEFDYTFDNLARYMDRFTEVIGLERFVLFVADYGGPVGLRIALAHPERIAGLIVQNAVSHDEGLGPLWAKRKTFWADRASNEEALWANMASLDALRLRHVGNSPNPERYDPDLWMDELHFLSQPGQAQIQSDLFFDYQTNPRSYSRWQAWLAQHQPRTLVVWGRYDPSFTTAGATAYKRDVPDSEVHLLDAGHFALEEASEEIGRLTREFIKKIG